jgi:hypothetical protein
MSATALRCVREPLAEGGQWAQAYAIVGLEGSIRCVGQVCVHGGLLISIGQVTDVAVFARCEHWSSLWRTASLR